MKAGRPWAVMVYKVGMALRPDDTVSEYAITELVLGKMRDTVITKGRAMDLIRQNGLELAADNVHGKIWHDPDNPLKEHVKK
jgi:hypothetical protein